VCVSISFFLLACERLELNVKARAKAKAIAHNSSKEKFFGAACLIKLFTAAINSLQQ
jgi:hypothetical protein